MRTHIKHSIYVLLAATILSPAPGLLAASEDAAAIADRFERFDEAEHYFDFLDQNCMECHNFEDWAGSLALDLMVPEEVADNIDVWENVVMKLRGRLMPPSGFDRPLNEDTDEFIAWLENYLDHVGAQQPHVGYVGLHRLNRKEYGNAIRDLLGLDVDATQLLPSDDSMEGFDNVAQALRVSPSFLEQSINSALAVASQAVGIPNPSPSSGNAIYRASGNQHIHLDGLPLGTRGGIAVEHFFPADGEYTLSIGNLVTRMWVHNQEYTHTLIATYDGVKFFEVDIGGGEDLKAIDQIGDTAVDAINAQLKDIPFTVQAGPHKLVVTFLHRSFAEDSNRLVNMTPGQLENVISLDTIEVKGPFRSMGLSLTPSRNQIFTCYPLSPAEESACAEQIISEVARKAFRGFATTADIGRLLAIYEDAQQQNGFELGIRQALTSILANPKFLFRIENIPESAEPGSVHKLTDLELASRLSFFLWSTIPDEELLDLAEAGNLKRPEVLVQQINRMLQDSRAETLASNFAYQWLNLAGMDEVDPDPVIFADIDFGVRDLFKQEIELFVGDIFLNNRNVTDLLTADYTYLNERLALHYGDHTVKGDAFRSVTLNDTSRYGLLGKGAVLMTSSYPDRTSPVLRGAYILEHFTGTPPPTPPPNVEALTENTAGELPRTVRARLEAHRQDPNCMGCHGIMDPLGFALEAFDTVGRKRSTDRMIGLAVDTTGLLPDGTQLDGVEDLRAALMERPQLFVQNLVEKLMIYALGRPIEAEDMPAIRGIVNLAQQNDYQFYDIVQGIISTDQFLYKQAADETSTNSVVAN